MVSWQVFAGKIDSNWLDQPHLQSSLFITLPLLLDANSTRFVENRHDLDEIRWDLASAWLDPTKSWPETSRFGQISTKVTAPSVSTETDHCPPKLKLTPPMVSGSWQWISCPVTRSCWVNSELGTNRTQINPWTILVPKVYF